MGGGAQGQEEPGGRERGKEDESTNKLILEVRSI